MKKVSNHLVFALSFLTVFPAPKKIRFERGKSGRSTSFFPLVGIIIGIIGFILSLPEFFHPFTKAVIICVFFLFITRGIHADGLLDTFDGFFSMKYRPEKIKKIMKDPGVGAMGFVGGFSFYLLKIAALFEIIRTGFPDYLLIALVPSISRAGISFICLLSKRLLLAKKLDGSSVIAEGLGKEFILSSGMVQFIMSVFFTLVFSLVFYVISGRPGVFLLPFLNLGFWAVWYIICKSRLGLINGDIMGAGIEISEVFLFFAGHFMLLEYYNLF